MQNSLHNELLPRLLNDYEFKERGEYLRLGVCPSCSKKELYTHAEHPWVLRCGRLSKCAWEGHVKEIYPDLFESWTDRYQTPVETNPQAAADAYMREARGFDLAKVRTWYTQEQYFDAAAKAGTSTVRFAFANGYWERLIDKPARFGKMKARFKPGLQYKGQWWKPPSLVLEGLREVWLVEGIFDAIALCHHDLAAVALMSSNNYPDQALSNLAQTLASTNRARPKLVWALDGDAAGSSFTRKFVERARAAGWTCEAAQIPMKNGRKQDWSDLHLLDRHAGDDAVHRLSAEGLKEYLHHGALLIAKSPTEKALQIYTHSNGRMTEFDLEFGRRLYWFKLDLDRYNKARDEIEEAPGAAEMTDVEKRDKALHQAGGIRPIANCFPTPLYFQQNRITDESWYYFRVQFPHDGPAVKNTFSSSQVSTASEFKKRLLGMAPGAVFSGTNGQLERMMERQLFNIKSVETIDFIGYSREFGCYVLGDLAVKDGRVHQINGEDFFEIGRLAVKSLNQSVALSVNDEAKDYRGEWLGLLWKCFGAKGLAALSYWLGSLFAEQIRATQKSYPFLEIVGEAGAGKSTLIEFLWKLCGRRDYEGFDPSKSSLAARARNFAQVSGLPVVLIESDRERIGEDKSHVKSFDWDELKTAYNGRSVRARGMATGGNETYEPPFRGAIVISQNATVNASAPILQRIVHLHFDTSRQTPATREAAMALESLTTESVSGFILKAAQAEAAIMKIVDERAAIHEKSLLALPGVKSTRIAKNHGQLMALADALSKIVQLTDEQKAALQKQIETMALERQEAINDDHPMVREFWEAFDYLDGGDQPRLNHSHDPELIAVNLNHFVQVASDRRQQIPLLRDLKQVLRTSKRRRFIEYTTVKSALHSRDGSPMTGSATIKCWVFAKEPS
ncbi:bifunctional DNA primase/helicase [Pandoraea cepalis]|uniref:Bifunctional DNA primase/helicase n=1 Tax=Pandoraea cepalis TaxID=2508294 RepID=A0AAW7MJP0_9BURK|nr:toprim domain-containing protein [Pandoraea cepalis]MDN4572886.1 bifunctional DNA primase/helicase [Pandoraea cepalis]MDN4577249.1 bifunctional DNA primase/helicase [Pandoraea cepalis]